MFGKAFIVLAAICLCGAIAAPAPSSTPLPTIAAACGTRDGWSDPAPPAHIHGHTWYVGTCGITVLLIETTAGLVLIDAGPVEAAPLVLANIRTLGFDPKAIKWLLSTHEHFDHAGGFAALQAATGARLAAGPYAATALRSGVPDADDPQYGSLKLHPMQPARVNRVMRDGGALVLGATRIIARSTPAHSPGSTSWTWRSCEAGQCLAVTAADSISTISADAYRFTDHPQRLAAVARGLAAIAAMPCDLIITPHPGGSNLFERLAGRAPLIDAGACRAYAQTGRANLAKRLASEQATK